MNSFLAYSYSKALNDEDQKLDSIRVQKNRVQFCRLCKSIFNKSKYVVAGLSTISFLLNNRASVSPTDSMLAKRTSNFNYNELYSFIRSNQLISYYQNGNRYFLFAISGKICNISESQLSFIAFLSSIIVGIIINVGMDHIRKNPTIKKKYNCLLTKLSSFSCWVMLLNLRFICL